MFGLLSAAQRGRPSRKMLFDEIRSSVKQLEAEIARGPIVPTVTPQEIRDHLAFHYDFRKPGSLNDIGADVERMLRTWQVQVTHPRYFGLFNPSVTVASIVGDTLAAMYNPQLATWRTSPAPNEIERHTLSWLAGKFGFPEGSAANFTSGGAEANLSAVVVALNRAFPEYGEAGLRCLSRPPTLYLTGDAHHSFNKIAQMVGLGRMAVRIVAVNKDLRMDLDDLDQRIAADRKAGFAPFLVIGTAGTTAAGAIDPLPELTRFCSSEGLWFHVDAAWGGAAILSPALKVHLAGIDAADSITCDAHKWFSVPMGAGMFFCRHPNAVAEAFNAETRFMPAPIVGPTDPFKTTTQWSRRFIGLKLFLALAEHGESGYIEMIEHQARMGDVLRQALVSSGWRVINQTPLPLVCFTRDGLVPSQLVQTLQECQIAWMSDVRLGAIPVVRACITSFRTTETDVYWVVSEMNRLVGYDAPQATWKGAATPAARLGGD